ncbi:hypothetical protein Tco_0880359 [Tanacetum coccineum]
MDIIAGRLSTIQTEIRRVEQRKLQCEQMIGLFWEHLPALDPEDVGRRMQFLRERIRSLENQKRALLEDEKDLIVRATTLGAGETRIEEIQPKTVGRERPKEDFLHHGAGNLLCKGHAIWLGLKNAGATYQRAMTAIFHEMIHVGLDLVETGEPAETVVRLPEVVEQKIPAYLELIGEELVVATLTGWGVGTFIGAVGKNTGLFLFSIVRKRSLVSHVPYVPSRYSHDSPLHLFSATVGSDLSRVRSLHSTRSLSFKGIPFLAMKSICASAVLTYEQAVQGLTWRTAFLTEE